MTILGYGYWLVAVIVGLMMLFDGLIKLPAEQIWSWLNVVMCAALLSAVAWNIRHCVVTRASHTTTSLLLSVFVFLTFTVTWIDFTQTNEEPAVGWVWIDSLVVIVLLDAGIRLVRHDRAANT